MRDIYRAGIAIALIALSATVYSAAQETPTATPPAAPPAEQSPDTGKGSGPNAPSREPTVTVIDSHEVQGVLGKEVRSSADENMGRIVDVIVDRTGQVRAAVIDFGGFLGVGSRKIAVDWDALSFPRPDDKAGRVTLEFTRDQVKAGPEYQDGKPVVVLGDQGKLEPFPFQ